MGLPMLNGFVRAKYLSFSARTKGTGAGPVGGNRCDSSALPLVGYQRVFYGEVTNEKEIATSARY